jgi:hypothetical protein
MSKAGKALALAAWSCTMFGCTMFGCSAPYDAVILECAPDAIFPDPECLDGGVEADASADDEAD